MKNAPVMPAAQPSDLSALMPAAPHRIVFRNPRQIRLYLRKRPGQPEADANYIFGPGASVEALDPAEEKLLIALGMIDVAKESPEVVSSLVAIQKQLDEQKAANAALKSQNAELEKQVKSVKRQKDSRSSPVK